MIRTPLAFAIVIVLVGGCGDDGEQDGPSPDVVADVRALQDAVTRDPAIAPLADAEGMVDEERSALAAQMLEQGGVPAARRQVEAVEAVEVGTAEGRRFRRRLAGAYAERVTALEEYQRILSRGYMEDLEFVEAMGAVRESLDAVASIDDELGLLRPLPTKSPRRAPNAPGGSGGPGRSGGSAGTGAPGMR